MVNLFSFGPVLERRQVVLKRQKEKVWRLFPPNRPRCGPIGTCKMSCWYRWQHLTICHYSLWGPYVIRLSQTAYIQTPRSKAPARSSRFSSPEQVLLFLCLRLVLLLCSLSDFELALLYPSSMAQVSIAKAFMLVFVVAIFSAAATVSALDNSPAPAPSPDAGSAFSLPLSGAVVASSLVFSLLAFLKY